jgi:hypothetical protein
MKKVILLSVFVLSLAFAGTVSAQAPAKKAPEKTVQVPAKTTEVKKDKKVAPKKASAKKVTPAAEKKTK